MDLIERQAAIDEWKNDFKGYINALNLPKDDYNGIMEYIDELPSAQPDHIGEVTEMVGDCISKQVALKGLENLNIASFYEENEHSREAYREIKQMLEALPSAQPSLYGYDFRSLIVFADAVNKKGISDSEIEDFVRNAGAAWEYAWEEFQRIQKEALDSIMRGDHHEGGTV